MSNGETGENGNQSIAQKLADQRSIAQPLWPDENPLDSSLSQNTTMQSVEQSNAATLNGRHGRRQEFRSVMPLTIQPERSIIENVEHFFDLTQPTLLVEGDNRSGYGLQNSARQLHERLQRYGAVALSTGELLFVVLGTVLESDTNGRGMRTLRENYNLRELLQADFGELRQRYGLDETKATQLQALLEVARRLTIPSPDERCVIRSPLDAVDLLKSEMAFLDHEELRVLVLDTKHGVVANQLLYKGTVNSSVVRVPEVFRHAITRNCPGIIVCHNHPSGSVEPSPEDIDITNQLVEAGKLLEIELIDHLIIGDHRYLSLKERLMWS